MRQIFYRLLPLPDVRYRRASRKNNRYSRNHAPEFYFFNIIITREKEKINSLNDISFTGSTDFTAEMNDETGTSRFAVPDCDDLIGISRDKFITDDRRRSAVEFIFRQELGIFKTVRLRVFFCQKINAARAAGDNFICFFGNQRRKVNLGNTTGAYDCNFQLNYLHFTYILSIFCIRFLIIAHNRYKINR